MFDNLKNAGGQAKKLWELKKQADKLKGELAKTNITAENAAGSIKITLNGEQKPTAIEVTDEALQMGAGKLGEEFKSVLEKAIDKSHQVAAEKMKSIAGNMGLPF